MKGEFIMIVTFCGHGNITYTQKTYKLLYNSIENFIINGYDINARRFL